MLTVTTADNATPRGLTFLGKDAINHHHCYLLQLENCPLSSLPHQETGAKPICVFQINKLGLQKSNGCVSCNLLIKVMLAAGIRIEKVFLESLHSKRAVPSQQVVVLCESYFCANLAGP